MTAAAAPSVVLGLPVHNSARFLEATLDSVVAQDHPRLEIVISDDASTDATPELVRALAARDERVRLQRHEERVGWIANYNSLLPHATGDYFLWVPHDDLYAPEYVSALVARLEARPEAVLAYSTTRGLDEHGRVTREWRGHAALHAAASPLARGIRYLWWDEREKFIPFRGVVRCRALQAVGGLEAGPWGVYADDLWLFRLALLGAFVHEPRALCGKRLHGASVSATTRYTYGQYRAYVGAHRALVRRAELTRRARLVLSLCVTLRQGWLAAWWALRAGRWRMDRLVPTERLRWYASPGELPRRLRKLASRLRGRRRKP
jgi:glycosyltransferase involved in cell wall biosynthesis